MINHTHYIIHMHFINLILPSDITYYISTTNKFMQMTVASPSDQQNTAIISIA